MIEVETGLVSISSIERAIADGIGLIEDVAQENPPEDRRFRGKAILFQRVPVTLLKARGLAGKARLSLRIDHEEVLDAPVGAFETSPGHAVFLRG